MTSVPRSALDGDPRLLVHAYLDGELDTVSALALEQRIGDDRALASELAAAAALQRTLRARFPREPVPQRLRARIDAATGATRWTWGEPGWRALAASVMLAVALSSVSTWWMLRPPAGDHAIQEVVDTHLRGLIAQRPADVASSERHTVKPWFNGRIAEAPRVVDLGVDGFPLAGARVDVIAGMPVPTLVYGRRQHVISLTAARTGAAATDPRLRSTVNGYNVVSWTSDGTTYWAVSDLGAGELETFARLFRDAPA
ncbi:MAG: anti-sigma factor [Hyphomicrobiales bacterium]|nr:anti-sigma factor [Hyphomicrobiales bacterium]